MQGSLFHVKATNCLQAMHYPQQQNDCIIISTPGTETNLTLAASLQTANRNRVVSAEVKDENIFLSLLENK